MCLCTLWHAGSYFPFLNSEIIQSKTTAPIRAVTKLPIMPPPILIPRTPKSHPPRTAPTIPTNKLTTRPKPWPFIIFPAKKPAARPIKMKKIQFIRAIICRLNNKVKIINNDATNKIDYLYNFLKISGRFNLLSERDISALYLPSYQKKYFLWLSFSSLLRAVGTDFIV